MTTEFRCSECLLRQPAPAFTRTQLMDSAIEEGALVLERTIDVHIKSLRRKLGVAGEFIETVRRRRLPLQGRPGRGKVNPVSEPERRARGCPTLAWLGLRKIQFKL